MSARNRIPTALEPYLRLPPETALILLTSILGCSVTWLAARFVGCLLGTHQNVRYDDEMRGEDGQETAVVLVSFMRDEKFWKAELRRTVGIDTTKYAADQRYTFIDFFTILSTLPPDEVLAHLEETVTDALNQTPTRTTTLILDNPDTLLALNLCSAHSLHTTLLRLRHRAHACIITCYADLPLLGAAAGTSGAETSHTPLETEGAAFAGTLAQRAMFVMGCRDLDTGAARDVSGVVSVRRGGGCYEVAEGEEVKEMEALYLVGRDGGAKVFERGAADI